MRHEAPPPKNPQDVVVSFLLIFKRYFPPQILEFFRTRLVVIVYGVLYSISIISLSQINSEYDCTDGQAQQWA